MKPKILIVGRVAWTAEHSTLCSVFKDYPADRLAYICIESKTPDFSKCANHLQISELLMVKNLFNKKLQIAALRSEDEECNEYQTIQNQEGRIGKWFRAHRSSLFLYLRELLWYVTRWKGKELQKFISDFDPDYLFFLSDPLPLMNRLSLYISDLTHRPAAIYMMDDIWSYKNGRTLYRYLLRKQVKTLIHRCNVHFAISELMKNEYDKIFDINSIILTKGIDMRSGSVAIPHNEETIKFVYVGQLIYGRDNTLLKVAETLNKINLECSRKAELHIYTQSQISEKFKQKFALCQSTIFHQPVPYSEVDAILLEAHVVLFVESLEKEYRNIAWLSFSTKITDYLQSGRCIFAVGDLQIAPIAYLNKYNAAIICDSYEKIEQSVRNLIDDPEKIKYWGENARLLGQNMHSSNLMEKRFNRMLEILSVES